MAPKPKKSMAEASEARRAQIVALLEQGLNNCQVAKKAKCTEGTVRYVAKQLEKGRWSSGTYEDARRTGRPPKISMRCDAHFCDVAL
jgi:transposase